MPKNEIHYWWPEAVSKFWADDEGQVNRIDASGATVRSPPKSFGGIRNDKPLQTVCAWLTAKRAEYGQI